MNRSDSIKRDRSFDSVLNKIYQMGSSNNQSFKAAMYNFLIAVAFAVFAAVCIILAPFVKPLLWAFLMGAVLFPFKRKLAQLLKKWFDKLEENETNVFVGMCLAPVQTTEHSGRILVNWLKEHWQIIVAGLGIATCSKLLYFYAPKGFLCFLLKTVLLGHSIFAFSISFLNIYLLIAILVAYTSSVYLLWKPENSKYFAVAGQTLWIAIAGYGCSFLGALQVPVFFLIMLYVMASVLLYLRKIEGTQTLSDKFYKLFDKTTFTESVNEIYKPSIEAEGDTDSLTDPPESNYGIEKEENLSNTYFKFLFYACVATFLYRNIWMFLLAAIPIMLHLVVVIGEYTGLSQFLSTKIENIYTTLKNWCFEHHSAILPLCLPGVLELNFKVNKIIRNSLKSSIDVVTSVLMIVLMILAIVFLGVFFCVNIYSETIEVGYLGKDLINKTITDRPELIDIIPANIAASIDDALDNAHNMGRTKIELYIDEWLVNADPVHSKKLKEQILSVWDRLIQYWSDFNKSDSYGPRVPTDALKSTFGEIVDNPELILVAKQGIIGWAKSNTNTIMEVGKSVWGIIQTNISVIVSFTGEILSLILSGGQACVEFVLNMIVFFTALFYLLASSDTKYAPLQIGTYFGFSSGNKLGDALENSISGVLLSMFKCCIFQGLFTWLVHTVFGARVVFLPSALAAILSAAPFLGSYWCALPAFLEMWLAQDRFYSGLLLFLLMFFVPPYFEQEIYAEMKGGGHPYLTGLAIAGGMYWMGGQGAIFGPLMLCMFIGIFEVASVALKSEGGRSPQDEDSRTM
ncbi:TMEM245 family protein [Megaselia abdita]